MLLLDPTTTIIPLFSLSPAYQELYNRLSINTQQNSLKCVIEQFQSTLDPTS